VKQVGILYQSHLGQATALAEKIAQQIKKLGRSVWLRSSWEDGLEKVDVSGTDLVISVGGDGTLLRVTRLASLWGIPILGINAGRLGFLTEMEAANVLDLLPDVLDGRGWVEDRTMLLVQRDGAAYYAMNEVVISRGGPARTVQANVSVDGTLLTAFRGDGVLISTATGSTAYNLAAGGPILPPTAPNLIIKPLNPHPVSEAAIIVDPAALVHVTVRTDHVATLTIDGQVDLEMADYGEVTVRRSPYQARFLHLRPPGYFYPMLRDLLLGSRRHPDLPDLSAEDIIQSVVSGEEVR
jgi:NAD+ kinase